MQANAGPWLLPWLLAAAGAAQHPVTVEAPAPGPAQAKQVTLPAGKIGIGELVTTVSSVARHNILCTEQTLADARPLNLTEPVQLLPETCEDLLCSLLYTQGFGLLQVDAKRGISEVVAIAGPRGQELMTAAPTRTAEEILAQPDVKRPVLTTYTLKHLNPAMAVNALRPMFAGAGRTGLSFGAVGTQPALTIRGWQHEVAAAIRLLQENDKPPPAPAGPVTKGDGDNDLAARVAALEKQIADLKRELAKLQAPVGK